MFDQRLRFPRAPRSHVELLDAQDNPVGRLTGVKSWSVSLAATERLGGSATLELDAIDPALNEMTSRVRITYDPGIPGVEAWPLGVFKFASPRTTVDGGMTRKTVGLTTKLAIVDEDCLDKALSIPQGANLVAQAASVLASTGEKRVAVTPSDAVARTPSAWDAGTPKLTVINDLLEAAGYWSLQVARSGQFLIQPYVAPENRPVSMVFQAGEAQWRDGWTHEQNLTSIPNKVVCRTHGSDEQPALVGVATNTDPKNPYSYQARGNRWITRVYDVDAEKQSVVDSLAVRRLQGAMSPVSKIEAEHPVYDLDLNEVVEFTPAGSEPRRFTIQKMSVTSAFDSQCSVTWRELGGVDDGELV